MIRKLIDIILSPLWLLGYFLSDSDSEWEEEKKNYII